MDKLAQISIPLYDPGKGKLEGFGPLGLFEQEAWTAPIVFATVISVTIGLMTIIAFIYFLFLLMIGGIGVMTAGGDKAKVAEARGKITSGLIGLVIVISAIFIFRLIVYIIGVDIFNLAEVINNL